MDGPAPRLQIQYRSYIVIPARLGSTRLTEKLLLSDTGKPLIQHTYESALGARRPEGVCVATDHPKLEGAVRGFGGQAVLTDPQAASGTDRVAEVARSMPEMDVLVNVQGDEPEISGAAIDLAVDTLAGHPTADMSTLATPIRSRRQLEDPACVKLVRNERGEAMYFSRSPIPHPRCWDESLLVADPPVFLQHVGLYAYRRSFLLQFAESPPTALEEAEKLEQLRALSAGHTIVVSVIDEPTRGIDTIDDYRAFVSRTQSCYTSPDQE